MSGPVSAADAPPAYAETAETRPAIDVSRSRETSVGGIPVRRALPRRGRRTVGAWCFVDHFGPSPARPRPHTGAGGMQVGPHPHTGLHTVTWLLAGEVLHRDSMGSEQLIRPGQLNVMVAGHGVSHAEETPALYRGDLHGVQLWVAQPEATRHGRPAFEHHDDLPRLDLGSATVTVLAGSAAGLTSPARTDTPLCGLDLAVRPGTGTLPLDPAFEHAAVVLDGALAVDGHTIAPGHLAYLAPGRAEVTVAATEPARALLLGGPPFPEPVLMWWNFVARTHDEIDAAYADWVARSGRFGEVASPLARIPAPAPPWHAAP